MSGLIEEIQRSALDSSVPVESLLRKVKLAAAKLGLGDVEQWVEYELNGYPKDAEVPAYRMGQGQSMALDGYMGWIPVVGPVAAQLSEFRIVQSVSVLTDLLAEEGGSLMLQHSPQIVALMNKSSAHQIAQVATTLGRSQLVQILDSVRNLVLDWAIGLEKRGITGEGVSFGRQEVEKAQQGGAPINIHHIERFAGSVGTGNVSGAITAIQSVNEARVFEELTQAIRVGVADAAERAQLERAVRKMEAAQGNRSDFAVAYGEFIATAAHHVTIITPFLPALAALFS